MDSLFDDDHDEVGSDIEAYCPSPRCKADTNHTIISMYEDEVRRVQCSVCGDVHAYRKPRGEAFDGNEGPSGKKAGRLKKKPSWDEAMAQVTEQELAACRPYSILDTYEELDVVSHPKFGVGFATELLPDNKVEITFKDERRVLVHNRSDLAAKMQPEISDAPVPRDAKRRKKRKGPQSELAARLIQERAKAEMQRGDFAEQALAKRMAAERAAAQRKRIAQGLDPEDGAAKLRADREAEKERKAKERELKAQEREVERQRKTAEREQEKVAKAKERERQKKEREKERVAAAKQREKDKATAAKERAAAAKQREKDKAAAAKERDKERAAAAKERARLQKERAAAAKERAAKAKAKQREKALKAKAAKAAKKAAKPAKKAKKAAKPAKKAAKAGKKAKPAKKKAAKGGKKKR